MHSQVVALVASHRQNFAAHFTGNDCVNVFYVAPQKALAFEGSSAGSLCALEYLIPMRRLHMLLKPDLLPLFCKLLLANVTLQSGVVVSNPPVFFKVDG